MRSLPCPVGTILSPCSARCWISLSSFYQPKKDQDLHRLQMTHLKPVGRLVFFSILFFFSPLIILIQVSFQPLLYLLAILLMSWLKAYPPIPAGPGLG